MMDRDYSPKFKCGDIVRVVSGGRREGEVARVKENGFLGASCEYKDPSKDRESSNADHQRKIYALCFRDFKEEAWYNEDDLTLVAVSPMLKDYF
ncbi:hypothetical protein [Kiloniella majae]|uniref:hypothetical protein n=1 Tax=Kiloniella majae TaxID=1938558 RepID=UPI000A278C42|nr:hypothetical protein [Kiloniella majae]